MGLGSSRMESGSPLDPDSNYTSIRVDDSDEEISDRLVCPICFTNAKDLAFGCGHLTCQDCGARLSDCPICRQPIEIRIRVFIE
ncbi:hypothetical protein CMV_007810 [Castanea mollissima]|uniref:RING-type domain-containing protein n=1 Tax=Castanea mollissima TaxID=60419 RepID=A0A8J4R8E2_9ROSI|nr:hypothetical protein CMV_007810 [Castanea mollissima]